MRRSAALALALVATAQSLRLAMPPRPAVARASHIVMAGKKQGKKASKKANAKAAEALAAAVGQPAPVSSVGLGGAKPAAGGPPPKASRITATPEGLRDVVLAEAARDGAFGGAQRKDALTYATPSLSKCLSSFYFVGSKAGSK